MAILVQSTPVAVVRYPVAAVVALQCYRSTPKTVVPVAPVAVLVPVAPVAVIRSTPVAIVRSTPVAAVVAVVPVDKQLRWLQASSGDQLQWLSFRLTPVAVVRSTPVAVVPVLSIDSSNVVPVSPVAVV